MSHYLTVPANRQETPPVRKVCFEPGQLNTALKLSQRMIQSSNIQTLSCVFIPEHQVYTYDDSDSTRGPTAQSDAVSLLNESPQRPGQRGGGELRAKDEQEELKLSRCLSDPGPNKAEEGDG